MKLYKNIKNIATFAVLIMSLNSCGDKFLAITPEDALSEEEFIGTPAKAQETLNGAYKMMADGAFMGGQTWLLYDLTADDIKSFQSNSDWSAHFTRTTDIFLETTRGIMHAGGRVVGRANYLLQNFDKVSGLSEAEKTRMTAEARFLRAATLFELTRSFGQPWGYSSDNSHLGVSIFTTLDKDNAAPRSTVKQCYDQILSDLGFAANNLPASNGNYANSFAAKAYLAKVHFQMNDFANAFNYANDVIQNSAAKFDPILETRFSRSGTKETVFQLVSTSENDNAGGAIKDYFFDNGIDPVKVFLTTDVFSAVTANPTDKRAAWFKEGIGGVICQKFKVDTATIATKKNSPINMPLAHLTEIKLIRAEAGAELNDAAKLTTAISDINDILVRAGLSPYGPTTAATTIIEAARTQRRIEMVAEGNRLNELRRQATHPTRPNGSLLIRNAPWNCNGMVYQIPDNELRANPDVVPNPSGGCN